MHDGISPVTFHSDVNSMKNVIICRETSKSGMDVHIRKKGCILTPME